MPSVGRCPPWSGPCGDIQGRLTAEKLLDCGHFESTISCLKADCPLEDGQMGNVSLAAFSGYMGSLFMATASAAMKSPSR